jgi:hypothetical protein
MKTEIEIFDFEVTQIQNPDNSKELPLIISSKLPEEVKYFQQQFKQDTTQMAKAEVGAKLTFKKTNRIQWKPTNALRTGGCYVEIVASTLGEKKYLYRVGPGCVVIAEKPRRDLPDGRIFSYPSTVLTIAKDLNTVFDSIKPELISHDIQAPTRIQLAHVGFTRSSTNAYEKFLDDDALSVSYIGLSDVSSEVFTFQYKKGKFIKIKVADLGLFKKRIITEAASGVQAGAQEDATALEKTRIDDFLHRLFDAG